MELLEPMWPESKYPEEEPLLLPAEDIDPLPEEEADPLVRALA
jgi:hypothetical protein